VCLYLLQEKKKCAQCNEWNCLSLAVERRMIADWPGA